VPKPLEIISGDGHAAFNFDGEKIRSVDQQQIDLIALAVAIKIKIALSARKKVVVALERLPAAIVI